MHVLTIAIYSNVSSCRIPSLVHRRQKQYSTVQYTLNTVYFYVDVQSGLVLRGERITGVSTHICAYHLEKAGKGPARLAWRDKK